MGKWGTHFVDGTGLRKLLEKNPSIRDMNKYKNHLKKKPMTYIHAKWKTYHNLRLSEEKQSVKITELDSKFNQTYSKCEEKNERYYWLHRYLCHL